MVVIAVATYEEGKPHALVYSYRLDKDGELMPVESDAVVDIHKPYPLSNNGGMYKFLTDPLWYKRVEKNPASSAAVLIQSEIDASSLDGTFEVLPPISIVKITKDASGLVSGYEGKCVQTITKVPTSN